MRTMTATLGGAAVEVVYAGAHADLVAVDQINLRISATAVRNGEQILQLRADSWESNPVTFTFTR